MNLRFGVADPQLVEQARELGFLDPTVAIGVNELKAVSQRVITHGRRLRWSATGTKPRLLGLMLGVAGVMGCRGASVEPQPRALEADQPASIVQPHPLVPPGGSGANGARLPPLQGEWLERVGQDQAEVVLMPPLGVVLPVRLVIAVHGAGDRSDWACGGWRLGSRVSALIACPRGSKLTSSTFAWSSAAALEAGVERALEVARARFGSYVASEPSVLAAFSQGASLVEPLLRKQASRFPIAILAEGGYQTSQSPAFASSYYAGGGRRVVLVCGTPGCFRAAPSARRVLERAGLEALVVGDPKAGHNLNQEMQRALQASWARIVEPIH